MAQFVAFDKHVEVNGQTVLAVVNCMKGFEKRGFEILRKNGIADPVPNNWYPQQAWLDAFREISGIGPNILRQIGKSIPENADFPREIDTIEKALASIDIAYHMNHRGGEIGNYIFRETGDSSGVVECPNPYPCDFDMGIIDAMARRFKPFAAVSHDASAPCRKDGADVCVYLVRW